jgi:lysozyme
MAPLTHEETIIVTHVLIDDESMQLLPYFDCCGKFFRKCACKHQGKLTIGVGRNIEDIGISENEALALESNDIKRCVVELERYFDWFLKLNTPRRVVITSMAFNLGISGLREFKKMITCIESGDFTSASKQMLNSKWAIQVNGRAERLAQIMDTGKF